MDNRYSYMVYYIYGSNSFFDKNYYPEEVYITIVIVALLLKDNNLITTSIGKKLRRISMIHYQNQ